MSEITKIKKFQIRPRFSSETQYSVEGLDELMKEKILADNSPFSGKATIGFISIYPHERDRHYWSPHLSVIVEKHDEGSLLRGHYGPSPAVWTMFVFLYAVIGLGAVIFSVIGFANRSIGLSGSVLWLVPILLLAFVSLYFVSYIGQKKGHEQIEAIHRFFEECIGQEIE